jgi:hypothetical protein
MSNREKRTTTETLDLYLAFARNCHGEHPDCIRTVIKGNYNELEILKNKLLSIGGYWRIHKTVNSRSVEKARIWLLKDLIDHPEHASYIDSQWRTALLQKECRATNYFMLDIDTCDTLKVMFIEGKIKESNGTVIRRTKSPKGWHYITESFDTRNVLMIDDVTLIRDGYEFICEVGERNEPTS